MQLHVMSEQQRIAAERARPKVDADVLERHLREKLEGEVRFDKATRAVYSTDASNYRMPPIGVVIPRCDEDVVKAVEICREHEAPLLTRGAGTSLAGQACNAAVILDFRQHLNRIIEIDPDKKIARVQPGCILDNVRDKAEADYQLTFGPDPSTHDYCTFGGMLGNNACGVHSVLAGPRTSDCTQALDVLTYDGLRMRVGETSDEELERIITHGGRRGQIYQGLKTIRDKYGQLIRERFPDIPRRVSGYNLDELLPEHNFNVARALVGTEGTCVTYLEATMQLVHSPPARTLVAFGFPDIYQAADHVPMILEHGPTGLEAFDHELIKYVERKGMNDRGAQFVPEGKAWLMVEFGGEEQEESRGKAEKLKKIIEKKNRQAHGLVLDAHGAKQLWELRKSGLGATAHIPNRRETWPGWEDTAVHPDDLGNYLRDYRKLLDKFNYFGSMYGHFGQGLLHIRLPFDFYTHEGIETYKAFSEEVSDLVVRYRGSYSGEHGDGQARARYLPKLFGQELVEAFREFKQLWDPMFKMNPGKVVDANPNTANLRLGADYEPQLPKTHFAFAEDNFNFAKTTLRCVGVGKCVRDEGGFMCPSYMATKHEKDSTRGRARALFEMLQGDVITDGWKSDEVYDVLSLCLSCKGCKSECPVDVDMATYKSEFLSHYYEGRPRPLAHFAMGYVERWAQLGMLAPGVANFFLQTEPFASALKSAAGIDARRHVPPLASQTFRQWFKTHHPANPQGKPVVLYPDLFNDYFYPHTLRSAVRVLERLGYRVSIPDGEPPEPRPAIHFGMLDRAKKQIQDAVRMLRAEARSGTPIVCLEPSTAAVFRDDALGLFPHDPDIARLKQNFHLFEEFLRDEKAQLPKLRGKAILHGHCHQKAVLDAQSTRELLAGMGLELAEPEVGCCGMAGAFGFEKAHYDVSVQIGNMNLVPAVAEADPQTLVVTNGFSCRAQLADMAPRQAMHVAEVMDMAFIEGDGALMRDRPERTYLDRRRPMASATTMALAGLALITGAATAATAARRKRKK